MPRAIAQSAAHKGSVQTKEQNTGKLFIWKNGIIAPEGWMEFDSRFFV